jgi:hypothetical protein
MFVLALRADNKRFKLLEITFVLLKKKLNEEDS